MREYYMRDYCMHVICMNDYWMCVICMHNHYMSHTACVNLYVVSFIPTSLAYNRIASVSTIAHVTNTWLACMFSTILHIHHW